MQDLFKPRWQWSDLREMAHKITFNEDFKSGGTAGKTTEDVTLFSQDLLNSVGDPGTSDPTSEITKDTPDEGEDMDDSDKSEKSDITDEEESAGISVKSTSDSAQNSAKKSVAASVLESAVEFVPETPMVSENESVPNVKKKSTMKKKSKKPTTRTSLDTNLETAVASGSDSNSREKHSQDSVAIAKPAVEDSGTTSTQGSIKSDVYDSVFTIPAQDSIKKGTQDSVKERSRDSVNQGTQDSAKNSATDSWV